MKTADVKNYYDNAMENITEGAKGYEQSI